jgi:hypothetical protein
MAECDDKLGQLKVRKTGFGHAGCNVRFGSKADIGEGATDVHFTPKSGH